MRMERKKVIIPLLILIILLVSLAVFAHTLVFNVFSGRVHFPEEYVGAKLKMEDGKIFTVLRRLQVEGKNDNSDGYAVFKVRFKFKSLKFETNKRLSMIPAPFLMGMNGFHEKYWTFNEETDYFQGIYQWESKEIAEKYPDSFIYKLMTKRAAPGTLAFEIIPEMDISKYIQKLSSDYQR
jgi:hypothetical protein